MASIFAPRFNHIRSLHSNIRTSKSDFRSILDSCDSIKDYDDHAIKEAELNRAFSHLKSTIDIYSHAIESLPHKKDRDLFNVISDDLDQDVEYDHVFLQDAFLDMQRWRMADALEYSRSRIDFRIMREKSMRECASLNPQYFAYRSPINSIDATSTQMDSSVEFHQKTIAINGNIAESSNDDSNQIQSQTDSNTVWQTAQISPFEVITYHTPTKLNTLDIHDFSSINSSMNCDDSTNESLTDSFTTRPFKVVPIPGTAPKKKLSHHSSISRRIPYLREYIHSPSKGWREGSRPVSINNTVESIAATKHPPYPLESIPSPIHLSQSDFSYIREDLSIYNIKHMYDDPWPDDLDHSLYCMFLVALTLLSPLSRPSTISPISTPLQLFTPHLQPIQSTPYHFNFKPSIHFVPCSSLRRECSDFSLVTTLFLILTSIQLITIPSLQSLPHHLNTMSDPLN